MTVRELPGAERKKGPTHKGEAFFVWRLAVITIGIAYGSDVALAMKLARKAATEYERVLDDPEPSVIFSEFGDNSLRLDLRVFLSSFDYFISTKSDLHQEINRQFADAGIQIAFPQRDVHLDTSRPLEIQLRPATE